MIRFGSSRVGQLEVHPTLSLIFSIDGDANVDVIDIYEGRIVKALELEGANRTTALAVSPNGRYIAIGGDINGLIHIWKDLTEVVFVGSSFGKIHDLAFSSDSALLVYASQTYVYIADFLNFRTLAVLEHSSAVHCVDFSPSGSYIAAGAADGTIRIWKKQ